MRRGIGLAVLWCAAVWAPSALATDWSAKALLRQSVEANDNRALQTNPDGETYEFASELFVSTVARLPGLRIELNADVSYRTLAGPGSDDFVTPMNNGANIKIEKIDRLTKYYLAGAWRLQDAVSAQIADTGVVIAKGDISTYVVDAGLYRQMSALDAVSWSVRGTSVQLDSSSLGASPYVGVTTTGAWIRQLSPLSKLTTSVQFELMDREAPAHSQTIFVRAMLGLESQLTKRLTFKAAAGAGAHRTNFDGPALPQAEEMSASWLGDLQLVYRPLAGTRLTAFAAQSIAPSAIGEIQNRASAGVRLRQEINHSSYLFLLGEFVHARSLDGLNYEDSDYFRGAVTYGYRLTEDWSAELSYRFAQKSDDIGDARSNAVFLSAVRNLVISP